MEAILLIFIIIILYAFLRSHGGKGFAIKAKLAPASTREGKRDRVIAWCLVTFAVLTIIYAGVANDGHDWSIVYLPFIVGGLTTLVLYFTQKRKK